MKHNGMYSVEHLQLESFQDLNMFVCECLRMYTTQMTTRKVTESFIFDGHIISVGTFIDIDLLLLHMNPLFWDLPEKICRKDFCKEVVNMHISIFPFLLDREIVLLKNVYIR